MIYRADEALLAGEDVERLATMAQLKAGRLGREVTTLPHIGAAWRFMNETPVSAPIATPPDSIGGGADEVMLMVLCKMMGSCRA